MRLHELFEVYSKDNVTLLKYFKDDHFPVDNFYYEAADVVSWNEKYWQYLKGLDDDLDIAIDAEDTDTIREILQEFYNWEDTILPRFPKDVRERFVEDIKSAVANSETFGREYAKFHMDISDKNLLKRTTWLIHFSDDAYDISLEGFKIGQDNMDLLAFSDQNSFGFPGFNFAFDASERYFLGGAKYGTDFVMFQNSGVKAYHVGDAEQQVMFYGPDVNPKDIIYVKGYKGTYEVMDKNSDRTLYRDDLKQVVNWIKNNHFQYRKQLYGR